MKPNPHHRITIPLTIAALCLTVSSCDQRATTNAAADQKSAELADQLAKLEAEKLSVAADKVEATRLRDESERLRAEAEIRQAIAKLSETPAPVTEVTPDAAIEKPAASTETIPAPAEVNVPRVTLSSEVEALPPLPPLPPIETDVSYEPFYDELSDEGSWMESEDYGYVWQPGIVSDAWEPYTDGGWTYTEYGWTWETNESFGSICYHYGRWTRLRGIGWVWVPGREWAPAWVSWRYADDCVGWAPLPPRARFVSGVGIHSWVDGVCHLTPTNYYFVSIQNICHPRSRDVLFSKAECEQRYLRSRNVTNLTEIRDSSKRSMVRCDGLPMDIMRKHLGSRLIEKKVEFDFSGRKPDRFVDKNDSKVVKMPHWSLDRHAGAGKLDKPKSIGRKLGGSLDVVHLPAKENRLAIRKLMAEEASAGLKQLPPRGDRGPRKDETGRKVAGEIKPNREPQLGDRNHPERRAEITPGAPLVTQPQTRPLPPVQKPLVPVPGPTPAPNVREIGDAHEPSDKKRPGLARPVPPTKEHIEKPPIDDKSPKEIANVKPFEPGEKAPGIGGVRVPVPEVPNTTPATPPAPENPAAVTRPPVVSIPPRTGGNPQIAPVRPQPQSIDSPEQRLREARELSQKQEEEWRKRRAEKAQAQQQPTPNLPGKPEEMQPSNQQQAAELQRQQQANAAEEAAKQAAAQKELVARQHQDELKLRNESIQRQQELLQRSKKGSPQMTNPPTNDAQSDLAQQAEAAREQARLRRVEELKLRQQQEEAQNAGRAKEKAMQEQQKEELKNRAEREQKQRESIEKQQDAGRRNQQMEQAEEAKKLQQQNAQREAIEKQQDAGRRNQQMEQAEEAKKLQQQNAQREAIEKQQDAGRRSQQMEQAEEAKKLQQQSAQREAMQRAQAEQAQQRENLRKQQEMEQRKSRDEAESRQQQDNLRRSQEAAQRRTVEEARERQQVQQQQETMRRQAEESNRRQQIEAAQRRTAEEARERQQAQQQQQEAMRRQAEESNRRQQIEAAAAAAAARRSQEEKGKEEKGKEERRGNR